jgi:hypothetical protein
MSISSDSTMNSESEELWKNTKIIKSLTHILLEIIAENSSNQHKNRVGDVFNDKKSPSLSLFSFIERILRYTHLEESSLVISLIYIDRMCEINDIVLTDKNIHRYNESFIY